MNKYFFTPEILDAMPEELAELFRELEVTLLRSIAERLVKQINEVALQNIRTLRSHGITLDEIKKAIQQTTQISAQKLDTLLDDCVKRNQKYYTELIDIERITRPAALVDAAIIDGIIRQTRGEIRNIARSMGFKTGNTFTPAAKSYQWALDNAIIQVDSGISYSQAIANATRQLADSGLSVIEFDSNGKTRADKVDVAVRRAVLTGVSQLNQEYADKSMEYLKTDLVQVSAHMGARNIGTGFRNHESWQGRVYRWAKYPRTSKGDYPDFVKTCGLGNVQGIKGANCRHAYSPFIEGMTPAYTEDELNDLKARKFTYQGKEYDTYTATQKQREIERTIRKEKVKLAGATNDTDRAAYKSKIRRLYKEYEDFSKAAGIRMQKDRANVYISEGK